MPQEEALKSITSSSRRETRAADFDVPPSLRSGGMRSEL